MPFPFSRRVRQRLVDAFDVLLFDLDGVLYTGRKAVPHAVESLNDARQLGKRLGFLTNNASRTPETVAEHLSSLGLEGVEPEHVVNSPQAAVPLLRTLVPEASEVLVIGGDGLLKEMETSGFRIVRKATPDTAAVIQGFSPDLRWTDLAEACYAIEAGAVWVATNQDWTIPRERGLAPGIGTLVAAVHTATGVLPKVAGKPERPLFDLARARFGATRPLFVGDRLDTDILGATRADMPSLLVLTGVDGPEAVLRAEEHMRPTYIGRDLRTLLEYYQPAMVGDGVATCGDVEVRLDRTVLSVTHGDIGSVEALRAACALVWTSGVPAVAVGMPDGLGAGDGSPQGLQDSAGEAT